MLDITELFEKHKLYCGRMLSGSKTAPAGQLCVFNGNVITNLRGKVWYGDLNITKEKKILKQIADECGETLYILKERDCRFDTANDPIDALMKKAVWTTDME